VRVGESAAEPTILATGGFQANGQLVAEHIHPRGSLRLRANRWSSGDGMSYALERGAELSAGLDEFYGRNMPDASFGEADIVALAPTRVDPAELPFPAPAGARVAVRVSPGITHTIGGLRIDEQARVVGTNGLFAAGADVGGISTGGYASGLAAALVFGRIA